MATTRVKISGPLFDGRAQQAADELAAALARETAELGAYMIKRDTERMTKSGSDTGRAAGGVELIGQGPDWVIRGGIREGEYSWPWLEGTSKRNASTGFRGYHTFRRTRLRLRKQAVPNLNAIVAEYTEKMGGAE